MNRLQDYWPDATARFAALLELLIRDANAKEELCITRHKTESSLREELCERGLEEEVMRIAAAHPADPPWSYKQGNRTGLPLPLSVPICEKRLVQAAIDGAALR